MRNLRQYRRSHSREAYRQSVKFGDRQALGRSVRATLTSGGDFPFSGKYWNVVHPLKFSAKTHYRTGNNVILIHVFHSHSNTRWHGSIMHSVLHFIRPCPNWPGWLIFWFSSYMLRKLLVSLTKSTGFFLSCASNSFLIDNYFYRKRDSGREI
jgi:hypothetical protein